MAAEHGATLPPSLSNGTQSFTAKDVDAAGNVSAASTALTVTVVTAAKLTEVGNHYLREHDNV